MRRGCVDRGVRVIGGELTWAAGRVRVREVARADDAPRARGPLRRRRLPPLLVPPQT